MAEKARRRAEELSTLNEFLAEEGTLETFEAIALAEVLTWQRQRAGREPPNTHERSRAGIIEETGQGS